MVQIALLVQLPHDWLWRMSARHSLINYTSHNKSSILQLSGLLYYLLLTCAQNTNVSQTGSGCSHKMIALFSQRSRRVLVEPRSVPEMQLLQLFLGSKQMFVIDNRWKCTVGTFRSLRSTTAAQIHRLIRYGREKGPDVMDSYSTEFWLWWYWRKKRKKKKEYQLLSSKPILLAAEKPPCYFILCSFDEDECICAPPHLTLAVRVH